MWLPHSEGVRIRRELVRDQPIRRGSSHEPVGSHHGHRYRLPLYNTAVAARRRNGHCRGANDTSHQYPVLRKAPLSSETGEFREPRVVFYSPGASGE